MTEDLPVQMNKLQSGTPFKQYHMLEQIGVGGQGVVWSALDHTNGRVVAIKFIESSLDDQIQFDDWFIDHQADQLLKLHQPNILPLFDYGPSEKIHYMVSPYVSGGSLVDWLKTGKFTTDHALRCAAAIASGVDYLHKQGIVHRDLKPGNILLDNNQIAYVTDFGLAHEISATTKALHTGHGTPPYASPEQHNLAQMTQQSDIYSFGVMLYEFFTCQLPWNGEKILALAQLQSNIEIPDPCEINPSLPPSLVNVLRLLTAANPAVRTQTMAQAMDLINTCFDIPQNSIPIDIQTDQVFIQKADNQELLKQVFARWIQTGGTFLTSLTKFAIIDQYLNRERINTLAPDFLRFMLHHALTYGFNEDFWWKQVPQPSERLAIAATLINNKNEDIIARTVNLLLKDSEIRAMKSLPPESMTAALLEVAGNSKDPWLRQECLDTLLALVPPAKKWQEVALNPEQDSTLAELALEDSNQGDQAAQLIGHLRSRMAAQKVIRAVNDDRRDTALLVIQKTAGSLPPSTNVGVRLGVSLDRMVSQLVAQPLRLLASYGLAFLGVALGFGVVVYLSYRYPVYLDAIRITNSLVRAVILGVPFGIGLFLTRVIAERFVNIKPVLRAVIASIVGGLVLIIAMRIYHTLILNTPPHGILITAGCLLTAFGFSMGALRQSRVWKFGFSLVATFAALAGSWWIHISGDAASQTPLFVFDYSLPINQVLGMILIAVLPMSILGNLVNLTLADGT